MNSCTQRWISSSNLKSFQMRLLQKRSQTFKHFQLPFSADLGLYQIDKNIKVWNDNQPTLQALPVKLETSLLLLKSGDLKKGQSFLKQCFLLLKLVSSGFCKSFWNVCSTLCFVCFHPALSLRNCQTWPSNGPLEPYVLLRTPFSGTCISWFFDPKRAS